MELIDYSGKLNNHKDYIDMLNIIEEKCKYIEVVVLDGLESNELIDEFKKDIISIDKVNEWWGTKTVQINNIYKVKISKELFKYLRNFETFCKFYFYGTNEESLRRGDYGEMTDFGPDDIAFYDDNDNCLLCTTSHEGYIFIDKDILNR